ncbi:hypothetical protein ANCDUO_15876, partial [Ancylostoma duodenale]
MRVRSCVTTMASQPLMVSMEKDVSVVLPYVEDIYQLVF